MEERENFHLLVGDDRTNKRVAILEVSIKGSSGDPRALSDLLRRWFKVCFLEELQRCFECSGTTPIAPGGPAID
jgi:hypothetical protein